MTVRPRHPALAALLVSGALATAPAAFAAAGKHPRHHPSPPSAQQVYVEQVPTAKGGHPVGGAGAGSVPLSQAAQSALARSGGKDKSLLDRLATDPGLGAQRAAQGGSERASAPNALNSAFSLGWGPTVLFAVLLGIAVLLAGYAGYRRLRH